MNCKQCGKRNIQNEAFVDRIRGGFVCRFCYRSRRWQYVIVLLGLLVFTLLVGLFTK